MNKYYSSPKRTVNEVEGTKIEKYRERRIKFVKELSVRRAVCSTINDSEESSISDFNCLI